MAALTIELEGEGTIDNASIYLEDPSETIEHKLDPTTDTKWSKKVTLPVDDTLDYSLYVVAFSGTRFKCTITRNDDGRSIEISGITGAKIKSRANIKGSKNFK
ncbi:hypothetical protein [Hymenobacter cellulosivorans]|uniref:PLAT domain-containing protein n=1 Tax=Hymenobacter cellulosivorans TaxID=2932249 RepID=A0ABY4FIP7_9BACT|nr:hypothetical protein [Hymenobacter cellulosivorans]UOQ54326.1 hypothetical protein MUN80_06095 [Hymenobacter cellulosivorans]